MRQRVKVSSKAVLQPIQLAAIAISTAFQKRRARRQGMSTLIRAAISTNGTCTIVFAASSSVPKANRAPGHIDPLDSVTQEFLRINPLPDLRTLIDDQLRVGILGKNADSLPIGSSSTNVPPGPVHTSSSFHRARNVKVLMF